MTKVSIPKLHSIRFKSGPLADNVTHIGQPDDDVPVINVLHGAAMKMLKEVCLIGYSANGKEYIASSTSNVEKAAFMYATAHLYMLRKKHE